MKKLFILIPFVFVSSAFAFDVRLLKVEPVVSIDRNTKFMPEKHTVTTTMYGARILYGPRAFSVEGEYLMGGETKSFGDQNLKIKNDETRYKLGIRSTINPFQHASLYGRAGFQGREDEQTITHTDTGLEEKKDTAFYVEPYVGLGGSIHVVNHFTLTADVSYVYDKDAPDLKENLQTSFGFRVHY